MFSFHGFDPKELTEKELFEKQLELVRKRMLAERYGKVDAAEQIKIMIQAIEFEQRERLFNDFIGKRLIDMRGVVVESDPELRKLDLEREGMLLEKEEKSEAPPPPSSRPVRRPMRTAAPVPKAKEEP